MGLYVYDAENKQLNMVAGKPLAIPSIIEHITLNGVEIFPVNKTVALTVITNTVNNLVNYYTKSQTYTKTEVDSLIGNLSTLDMQIVESLPTSDISTTTIYLVATGTNNTYTQYAYIDGAWATLGTTEIDLSNYYTKAQIDAFLADKQDVLSFDSAPTNGSTNPVTSNGIFVAIKTVSDIVAQHTTAIETLNGDETTEGSVDKKIADALADISVTGDYEDLDNLPQIEGVELVGDKTASDLGLQEELTFDNAPTENSDNVVSSGAVYTAVEAAKTPIATADTLGKVKPDNETCFVDENGILSAVGGIPKYEHYSMVIDQTESNPASIITYADENADYESAHMDYTNDVFRYGSWENAWFIKKCRPCMLKYDGKVDYYLDPNDPTKKEDGTASDIANTAYAGNAMVEFPKVYIKFTSLGEDKAKYEFSNIKLDADYHCYAHMDKNGAEIDYCYMPMYTGSIVDGKMRSLSGRTPMANYTAQQEINYAKANNLTSDEIWNIGCFSDWKLINLLLLLIGKSTNTRTVIGSGNNSSYVSMSNTGIKATGTMNTKGMFWGNQDNVTGVKVFYMEHFWGNQWRRINGWINDNGTQKIKMTYSQEDGSTVDGYNLTGSGYILVSSATPSGTDGGYISKVKFTENGLIPYVASGSDSTYYCDGLWFNNSQVDVAVVGGAPHFGLRVGALCSALNTLSSATSWSIAAALSCKPLAA